MTNGIADDKSTQSTNRFNPLFEANYMAIYRYCVRRLGHLDAEDAAADVFAVAWRRIDEMPSSADRAWLFGVAYRVIGNNYRYRRRQRQLTNRLELLNTDSVVTDPSLTDEVEVLYWALDQLGKTDRELLRLSAWDGLTRAEIAYVLGINENAVDQRLHRARTRLRTRFERLSSSSTQQEAEEAST